MCKQILIITNDVLFPILLTPLLNRKVYGVEVVCCKSKLELDQVMDLDRICLFILDDTLLEASAFEIMRYLRIVKKEKHPIWFFPEVCTEAYLTQAYVMGATIIIKKPFDPFEVTEQIAGILTNK